MIWNVMRQRVKQTVKPVVILLTIGFLYIMIWKYTGLHLFCLLHRLTGLYCPGCGISRMFLHILKGEWQEAFSSNCVVFCLLPFFGAGYLRHTYRYIRFDKRGLSRTENRLCYLVIVILILFGIVRNIYPADILIP